MKAEIMILIVLTGILITACQTSVDVENEKMVLLQTDREFAQTSVELGAAEAFKRFLDANALQLPAGQKPVRGVENIYRQMKKGADSYTMSWEPQEGDVAASGDLGYTWGIYKVTVKNQDDSEINSYGKYLNIWKKQPDGSWKVLVDMGNQNPDESKDAQDE